MTPVRRPLALLFALLASACSLAPQAPAPQPRAAAQLSPAAPLVATLLPVVPAADTVLNVQPSAPNWLAPLGEPVSFRVAFKLAPYPAEGVRTRVKLGPEMFEGAERDVVVPAEGLTLTAGALTMPGFVRCSVTAMVNGKARSGSATVGVAPERIAATQTEPADFDAFWDAQKAALARVPLDLQLVPAPDLSTPRVQVWRISFQNVGGWSGPSRFHGVLAMPVGPGPFPAVLTLPGAGVRPYRGEIALAEQGFMTLQVGIHGIPVDLPPAVYEQLASGALKDYPRFQLDDREAYYYRRVLLGALRASEVLAAQPQWDGKTLLVAGGSQGGQLSIATAALNPRITGLAASYPAYSDVSGYLHGRAGGWPGLFRPGRDGQPGDAPVAPKLLTSGYYDSVNFARRLKVPGHYAWGFNDTVTPPTSLHAAYNVITAPKQLLLAPEQGHALSREQARRITVWLREQAGLQPAPAPVPNASRP